MGVVIGNFPEQTFRNKVFAGEISPNDLYWREGFRDWQMVSEFRVARKTEIIILEAPASDPPTLRKPSAGLKSADVIAGILVLALVVIAVISLTRW